MVRGIRAGVPPTVFMEPVWLAWQFSVLERKSFSVQSFGWVALGAIFEAIKGIEESELESAN